MRSILPAASAHAPRASVATTRPRTCRGEARSTRGATRAADRKQSYGDGGDTHHDAEWLRHAEALDQRVQVAERDNDDRQPTPDAAVAIGQEQVNQRASKDHLPEEPGNADGALDDGDTAHPRDARDRKAADEECPTDRDVQRRQRRLVGRRRRRRDVAHLQQAVAYIRRSASGEASPVIDRGSARDGGPAGSREGRHHRPRVPGDGPIQQLRRGPSTWRCSIFSSDDGVKAVYAYDQDRLARSNWLWAGLLRLADARGIRIVAYSAGDIADLDDDFVEMRGVMDGSELRKITKRNRAIRDRRKARGDDIGGAAVRLSPARREGR